MSTTHIQHDGQPPNGCLHFSCSVCDDVRERLKGHVDSCLDGEHGLAAATMRGFERMLGALEAIEQIYVDGDNTHDDWKAMGKLARNVLHEPNEKINPTAESADLFSNL